jgi:hypothetical protein
MPQFLSFKKLCAFTDQRFYFAIKKRFFCYFFIVKKREREKEILESHFDVSLFTTLIKILLFTTVLRKFKK